MPTYGLKGMTMFISFNCFMRIISFTLTNFFHQVGQSPGPVTTPQPRITPFMSMSTFPTMAYQVYPTLSGIPDAPLNSAHINNNNNATAISISFKNTTNLHQSIPLQNATSSAASAATGNTVKPINTSQQQPSTVVTSASAVHDTKQPIEFPSASDKASSTQTANKTTSSLVKNPSPVAVTLSQHSMSTNNGTIASVNSTNSSNDAMKLTNNTATTLTSPTNSTDAVVKVNNTNNINSTITNSTSSVAGKTNLTADKTTTASANSIPVVTVEKVIHPSLRNSSTASSLVPNSKNESKKIPHLIIEKNIA